MSIKSEFSGSSDPYRAARGKPIRMETPRLIMREHTPADAEKLHAMTSKPGFKYYCFDGSREKVDAFLKESVRTQKPDPQSGMRDNHMLALEDKTTGVLVGHVCLERVHYHKGLNYEINFFVDPAHQNKGYGREAAVNMMHYGFNDLGLYAYTVTIHPQNGPSRHVAMTEGYQKIADISIDTVHGEEPRDLYVLTKDVFYALRQKDKRPMILNYTPPAPPQAPQPPRAPAP
jgi:RimJ/RimL family protein N-acetyltransferase